MMEIDNDVYLDHSPYQERNVLLLCETVKRETGDSKLKQASVCHSSGSEKRSMPIWYKTEKERNRNKHQQVEIKNHILTWICDFEYFVSSSSKVIVNSQNKCSATEELKCYLWEFQN